MTNESLEITIVWVRIAPCYGSFITNNGREPL